MPPGVTDDRFDLAASVCVRRQVQHGSHAIPGGSMTDISFPNLSTWLARSGATAPDADLGDLKTALSRLGVNQRGWRLLLSYGETIFSPLEGSLINYRRPLASLENLSVYLRLLQQCEMDVPPPPALVQAWGAMKYPDGPDLHLMDVPVGLFRASWLECVRRQYQGTSEREFLDMQLPLVVDWFFRAGQHQGLGTQQLRRNWDWFWSRYARWAELCRHSFDHVRDWASLLGRASVVRGVLVVELTSADAIREEGRVMHHCVADCIEGCRAGRYRVFSLRVPRTGERLVTLGVTKDEGEDEWWMEDCRGEDNADAETDLLDAAADVVDMCTDAERSPRRVAVTIPERSGVKSLDLFSGESAGVKAS